MTHKNKQSPKSFFPFILLIVGIVFIGISLAVGGAEIGLLLFIPFIIGNDVYSFVGIIFIVLAMFSMFFLPFLEFRRIFTKEESGQDYRKRTVGTETDRSYFKHVQPEKEVKKKAGGVVVIGPIPIIFGSDPKTALWVAVVGFVIFLVVLLVLMF